MLNENYALTSTTKNAPTNKRVKFEYKGSHYEINADGEVFGKDGVKLKVHPNQDGYAMVTLGDTKHRTSEAVHRLVAKYFVPNPNHLKEVDHLDGNRMNPKASNLEYVTHQENIDRAVAKGSYKGRLVGEKNIKVQMTEEEVLSQRKDFYTNHMKIKEIADKYGRPWTTVSNAVKGITWSHLPLITK